MADVLKQTLYFNAAPTETLTDINGTNPLLGRNITAAESHDASDTTYHELDVPGDGIGTDGLATTDVYAVVGTASTAGGLSFLRVKARARVTGAGSSGTWQPRINGTPRGTATALSTSFTDYTQDFTTDPADSNAWTDAKVNAQTFGVLLQAAELDANFPTAAVIRFSEFEVQLWGPNSQTLAPSAAGALVSGVTPTLVPNAVGLYFGGSAAVASGSNPTLAPQPLAYPMESANINALSLDEALVQLGRDPTAFVTQASYVDTAQTPKTIRSALATYNDQSLGTKTTHTSAGALLKDLGGLEGTAAINGIGPIAGVKLFAIVRATTNGGTLTNMKFGTAGGVQNFVTQPTVTATATPDDTMWSTVESGVIDLNAFAVPFEWGNGVNSVWAGFVSPTWTLNATITGTARLDIAEAWLEVVGPVGSDTDVVRITQRIGNVRRIQSFPDTLTTE